MKNIKAISGVLLIFVLGATSGVLGTHIFYKSRIEALTCGESRGREDHILRRLGRDLNLDDQQLDRVKTILHETREEMKVVRKQYRPQIEAALEKGHERIRKILRQDQQEIFEKIIAERRARRNKAE